MLTSKNTAEALPLREPQDVSGNAQTGNGRKLHVTLCDSKLKSKTISLYRCNLITVQSHIDALGFEQRLLVDANGQIYTGHCATFIPKSLNRISDRNSSQYIHCITGISDFRF